VEAAGQREDALLSVQEYDLLTIEAVSDGRRSYRATGFLAEQGVDMCAKMPFVTWLAGMLARLRRERRVQVAGAELEVDPQAMTLKVRGKGLLRRVVQRQLDRLCARLDALGRPIAVREGGLIYNLYQTPLPTTRFINAMARHIAQGPRPYRPTTCTLQVTARCQLNCFHCSAARYRAPDREELSTEELKSVIRQSEELGVYNIVLTGGEPLLHPDLFELIEYVDRDRAQPLMFTNGLLITDEKARQLAAAGLYAAMVSIDDPRAEMHETLRCVKGGFEKAIEGARRLIGEGVLVGISTYASPEDVNEGRVEEMIELTREIGAEEITIFDLVPTGKLLGTEVDGLLSHDDKERLIAIEEEYNGREGYPHVITQAKVNGPKGTGCFAGFIQFYMTAYGDINPCDFTPLTFGNVRDESLAEIWDRMQEHPAYCERCDHCRMQDAQFRARYIDHIPPDVLLPWPAYDELRELPHAPPLMTLDEAHTPGLAKQLDRHTG